VIEIRLSSQALRNPIGHRPADRHPITTAERCGLDVVSGETEGIHLPRLSSILLLTSRQ